MSDAFILLVAATLVAFAGFFGYQIGQRTLSEQCIDLGAFTAWDPHASKRITIDCKVRK